MPDSGRRPSRYPGGLRSAERRKNSRREVEIRFLASLLAGIAISATWVGSPAGADASGPGCLAAPSEFSELRVWTPGRWKRLVGPLRFADAETAAHGAHRFGYYRFGNPKAEPLVLLMGHGAVMLSWDPAMLADFARCFDVYMFDNLGIGRSRFGGDADSALATMTFEDMADFAARAVAAIESLRDRRPHGLGWAMGAKVLFLAAERNPERFGVLVNGGGWVAKPEGTGPNPCAVEELEEMNPWAIASTTFRVSPSQWGWGRALRAFRAQVGMMARTSVAYVANWGDRAAWPTPEQRHAQARASAAPYANDLRRIRNPSFVAYGRQDDRNFPFPARPGAACARGAIPPARCSGARECWWGLGPFDDYERARDLLENAERVCLQGFEGAHGFLSQSRLRFIPAVVDFVSGAEIPDCETAESAGRPQEH